MASDDLQLLEDAFESAVALKGYAQDRFVAEFSQKHPELGPKLVSLLAADRGAEDAIVSSIEASIRTAAAEPEDHWTGRRIGSWEIIDRIGTGGMGAVYRAQRSDGEFDQSAAIKIMAAQLTDRVAVRRFTAERQILAELDHPNIARLIDGGSTEARVPYLVMELVQGEHVDRYCDERQLTVPQRLEIIRKICDAVDYAHRKLIVHRDLKPSNILVNQQGEPKLLDFGIAKLLQGDEVGEDVAQTAAPQRAMTPEYASPEQVRGEPASVAVDVYALGVLMYRLLTGHPPYGEATQSAHELQTAILNEEPRKPSIVAATNPTSLSEASRITAQDIGAQRQATPDKLRRTIAGDLDTIILKCLQKDALRRYPNVRELGEDLRRYLRGLPITARGDDFPYRLKRFASRNKRPLIAAAATIALLIGSTAFYTVNLAIERDRAALAAARSDQVAQFLKNIFESANPASAPGETITAQMLLDSGLEDVEQIEDPAVKGALLRSMGVSYGELGNLGQARTLLERSVALFRDQGEGARLDLARSLDELGVVESQARKLPTALKHRSEAVGLARQALADDPAELPFFISRLAVVHANLQQHDQAIELWKEALALQRDAGTFGDALTSDILGDLAVTYDNRGKYELSLKTGLEALDLSERTLGPLDPNTVVVISNLGLVANRMGRYELAVQYTEDAIKRGEQLWPPGHWRLSFYRIVLAAYLTRLGRFDRARQVFGVAQADIAANEGKESANYSAYLLLRADHSLALGDPAAALGYHREGVEISKSLFGETGELTIRHRMGVAAALAKLGDLRASEAMLRVAMQKREHLRRANQLEAQVELAETLTLSGQFAEASDLLTDAIAQKESDVGTQSSELLPFLAAAARLKRAAGDYAAALIHARRASEIAREELPVRNWNVALANAEYAYALDAAGRQREARQIARQAADDLEAVFGSSDSRVTALAALSAS